MRVYLVRHGQSEALAGLTEDADCPLTQLGLAQAGAIAAALARSETSFALVLSSPFRRCLQTAEVIRRVTGSQAEIWPAIHEHQGDPYPHPAGKWPLPTRSELAAAYPKFALPPDMPETHWAAVPEDRPRQWQRISTAVRELLARFARQADAAVAVITHGAPASVFVQAFCLWTNPLRAGVRIDPGSISILEVDRTGRRILVRLNWIPEAVK